MMSRFPLQKYSQGRFQHFIHLDLGLESRGRGVFDSRYKQSTESFRNWPHHFHWGIGLCQSLENSEDPEPDLPFDPAPFVGYNPKGGMNPQRGRKGTNFYQDQQQNKNLKGLRNAHKVE